MELEGYLPKEDDENNIQELDYENGTNDFFCLILYRVIRNNVHKLMMKIMVSDYAGDSEDESSDAILEFPASFNIASGKIATVRLDLDILKSKVYL